MLTHNEVVDIQIADLIELTEEHDLTIKDLIIFCSDLKYRVERLEKQLKEKES